MGNCEPRSIVFFIVDSDNARRSFYLRICSMIKGVEAYGCEFGEDALKLIGDVVPDAAIIAYSLCSEVSGIETISKIKNKNANAVISAIADVYNHALEKEIKSAGAVSVLAVSLLDDSVFHFIKNMVALAYESKSGQQAPQVQKEIKPMFDIIYVNSYARAKAINRNTGLIQCRRGFLSELSYIRVFSCLYDFFVKCFLKDIFIRVGFSADEKRLIILFNSDANILSILKKSVFYFISEQYIKECDGFCYVLLKLKDIENDEIINYTNGIACGDIDFLKIIGSDKSAIDKLLDIRAFANELSSSLYYFSYIYDIIPDKFSLVNEAELFIKLSNLFSALQERLEKVKCDSSISFENENLLIADIMRIGIAIFPHIKEDDVLFPFAV